MSEIYGKLPLTFEENRGQVDGKVEFLSHGSGYTLLLSPTEAVLALSAQRSTSQDPRGVRTMQPTPSHARSTMLRMKLVGANPSAQVAGLEELPGKINYFIGSDQEKWRKNIAAYAKVKYREVYPGIDLVYYGNQRQFEYDGSFSRCVSSGNQEFGFRIADYDTARPLVIDRHRRGLVQQHICDGTNQFDQLPDSQSVPAGKRWPV